MLKLCLEEKSLVVHIALNAVSLLLSAKRAKPKLSDLHLPSVSLTTEGLPREVLVICLAARTLVLVVQTLIIARPIRLITSRRILPRPKAMKSLAAV